MRFKTVLEDCDISDTKAFQALPKETIDNPGRMQSTSLTDKMVTRKHMLLNYAYRHQVTL